MGDDGILDMFLGTIGPQPIRSHLELARRETKGQEGENPNDDPNGIRGETFQRANVHGLGAIHHHHVLALAKYIFRRETH